MSDDSKPDPVDFAKLAEEMNEKLQTLTAKEVELDKKIAQANKLLSQGFTPQGTKLDKHLKKVVSTDGKVMIVERTTLYVPNWGRIFKSRLTEKASKEPLFAKALDNMGVSY